MPHSNAELVCEHQRCELTTGFTIGCLCYHRSQNRRYAATAFDGLVVAYRSMKIGVSLRENLCRIPARLDTRSATGRLLDGESHERGELDLPLVALPSVSRFMIYYSSSASLRALLCDHWVANFSTRSSSKATLTSA